MVEPYVTGFVGPNNVIQADGLTPGIYRVVIEPEGMAPIDFRVEVGPGVTEALATVDANGNVTVTYGFQHPPSADLPPADSPADPPVTGLPETGAGTGSNVGALGALVGGAVLAAGALGAKIRKS